MEEHNQPFDQEACRMVLADLRLWLDEELYNIRLGRIEPYSNAANRIQLLGEVYDRFHDLMVLVVTEETLAPLYRKESPNFLTEIAFLRRERAYYRSTLIQERASTAKFYEFALRQISSKQEGGDVL
jgi:hypothetical protein